MPEKQAAAPDNGSGRNADHADQAGESHITVPAALKPASKFDWLTALFADPGITDSAKVISAAVALKNVDPGGLTFRVRQTTIADRCATTERTVQRAFKALRNAGWIELVDQRTRGRGHHAADRYRLSVPEIPDRLSPITDEIPDSPDANTRQPRQKYPTAVTEIPDSCDTNGADEQQRRAPKGFSKGISKGLERGSAADCVDAAPAPMSSPEEEKQADDDPEPPLFCPEHPYGTVNGKAPKCGRCGTHRIANEAWHKRHPEADANRHRRHPCRR
jgi:hypothetical protein